MANDLTTDERRDLTTLENKLDHLRDSVRGVAQGYQTGLFVHGEGGTSKSYTVLDELRKLKSEYIYHNTRMTARGLIDALQRSPTSLHLIEDAETMMDDRKTPGVIRSACWSNTNPKARPMIRPITWGAHATGIRFDFTGGLIVISNANLATAIPEIRAMKSRIIILGMDVSAEQIKALMKKICLDGFTFGDDYIVPDECLEVRQRVIDRLSELKRNLDLRVMINGFKLYLQWKNGDSKLHWHDLLDGLMSERTVAYKDRVSKQAEKHQLAMSIHAMSIPWAEKLKLWKDKMNGAPGSSQAGFDRALKWQP